MVAACIHPYSNQAGCLAWLSLRDVPATRVISPSVDASYVDSVYLSMPCMLGMSCGPKAELFDWNTETRLLSQHTDTFPIAQPTLERGGVISRGRFDSPGEASRVM